MRVSDTESQPFLDKTRSSGPFAWSSILNGWRLSLVAGAAASSVVFIINISLTIRANSLPKGNGDGTDGRRILYEGSCGTSKTLNLLLHIVINVFSSILLAASSYCMQCLTAPTRAEVDKAHAREEWMDIGVLSIRNLRRMSWMRVVLWGLLALSSIPLHLLYNSVVFSSLSTIDYTVYNVGEHAEGAAELLGRAREENWKNLTALQCINDYGIPFQTSRSDVVLVCDQPAGSNGSEIYAQDDRSFHFSGEAGCYHSTIFVWVCRDTGCGGCGPRLEEVKQQANDWEPYNHRVKYCLSKPRDEVCRVNFNRPVAIAVLVANAAKALILIYVAISPPEEPLFVLGDAIQSFLRCPDSTSRDMCLASMDDVKARGVRGCVGPRASSLTRKRRAVAASRRRWILSFSLYCLALGLSIFCLSWGIKALTGSHDIRTIWNLGFGTTSETALIAGLWDGTVNWGSKILQSILLANTPQFLFSILYFQVNGLLTCMLSSKEWADFGSERKAVRVSSSPEGNQRSRYFLQLPYRYSIPLLAVSTLMHWLLSQSIFVVAVETERAARGLDWTFVTCGYSPLAIVCTIAVSLVMAAGVVITARRRLPASVPIVGSCSLAIAAACHHPDGVPQPKASLLPLKWGVMGASETYPHCGLSSEEVGEIQAGVEYQ